jgi:hypothetical protein
VKLQYRAANNTGFIAMFVDLLVVPPSKTGKTSAEFSLLSSFPSKNLRFPPRRFFNLIFRISPEPDIYELIGFDGLPYVVSGKPEWRKTK